MGSFPAGRVLIGKAHMGKGHLSFDGRDFRHIFFVGDSCPGIHDFKNPLGPGNVGDNLVIKIAEIHNRVPEHGDVAAEGKEGSHGHIFRPQNMQSHKVKGGNAHTPA